MTRALLMAALTWTAVAGAQVKAPVPVRKDGTATIPVDSTPRPLVKLMREVFVYQGGGRRDPFVSLMTSGQIRPLPSDLKLVTVLFDPEGTNSVAVLRDVTNGERHRVKVGDELGRLHVVGIHPKSVTFTVDELGYRRKETIMMGDSVSGHTP